MFSLLGKGRPLTGALLFPCQGGRKSGSGTLVPPAGQRRFRAARRSATAGSGRRPERPAGPSSAGICGRGKVMGLQDGGGGSSAEFAGGEKSDGFADRGRGRCGGGGRRPPPAPAAGRTVRRTVPTGAARRFRRSRNGLRPALSPLGKAPPMRYNRGRTQGKRGAAP